MTHQVKVGDIVFVPWGLGDPVKATVLEVWGDPPIHVRVQLQPEDVDESDEPTIILISPKVLSAA